MTDGRTDERTGQKHIIFRNLLRTRTREYKHEVIYFSKSKCVHVEKRKSAEHPESFMDDMLFQNRYFTGIIIKITENW